MAKRFVDSDKYKKDFIKSLPGAYKLLWDYINLDCSHAGIWHVEFDVAQIRIGMDMLVDKDKALELFNSGEQRIIILDDGKKWLIKPFIEFQYGCSIDNLNPNDRVHKSVVKELEKVGIKGLARGLSSPLSRGLQGAKDKVKDKVKDNKGGVGENAATEELQEVGKKFEDFCALYPKPVNVSMAYITFKSQVKTDEDFNGVMAALKNYVASDDVHSGFIKNADTWLVEWREWLKTIKKDPLAKYRIKT